MTVFHRMEAIFMIKKTEKMVVTFHTTTDAMAMERVCREHGVTGRLIPVPRMISADCGLAWCADPSLESTVTQLMRDHGLGHQDIHRCLV